MLWILVIASSLLSIFGPKSDQIIGVWMTAEQESKIEIYKKGNQYYGKIVWIEDELGPDGKKRLDVNNPDEHKRNRPLVGLTIVKNLEWDAEEREWNEGEVYDPESGSTYSVFARLQTKDELYLKGYIGFSLLGRSTVWKRVEYTPF